MKIEKQLTAEAVLEELGQRIARRRLDLGITQANAAEQAGLGKRTVERIESGEDSQLSTFIRLLRVLELMEGLENLVPEVGLRPMEMLNLKGRRRRRASSKRSDALRSAWQWGDKE